MAVLRLVIVGAIVLGGVVFRDRLTGNVADLRVGDCFDLPASITRVEDVQHHPCTEPHMYEAFAEVKFPAESSATYPGETALDSWAQDKCVLSFPGYIGRDYRSSALGIVYFTPSVESWGDGDRVINCVVSTDPPSAISTSLRGSAR